MFYVSKLQHNGMSQKQPAKSPATNRSAAIKPPPPWSDRKLYDALQQNGSVEQQQALQLLYQELYPISLYMFQRTNLADPQALAQDCAQEALVKVWRQLAACQQPDALRNWAKTIVRNQTLNEIAAHKRKREEPLAAIIDESWSDGQAPPDAELIDAEWTQSLLALLNQAPISPRTRFVILAKYLWAMSDIEICQVLATEGGVTVEPSHIQVTRAKGLKVLRNDPLLCAALQQLLQKTPG